MKTTTKIIFGAALSVLSLASLSNQAWAAEMITPTATFLFQPSADVGKKVSVDHLFYRFDMKFKLPNGVRGGDFFEVETHGIPFLNTKQDILDGENKNKIGEMTEVSVMQGTRQRQIVRDGNFEGLRPSDSMKKKYRFTFNRNVESLNDVSFGFSGSNIRLTNAVANRDYTVESWIDLNGTRAYADSYTVGAWGKFQASNYLGSANANLNLNQGEKIILGVAYLFKKDAIGADFEVRTDNGYYRFSKIQKSLKYEDVPSAFIYTDSSVVNQNGVILYDKRSTTFSKPAVTDNGFSTKLLRASQDEGAYGLGDYAMELTDEGKKFVAENGILPEMEFRYKISKDGQDLHTGRQKLKVTVVGQSAEFLSKIKQEVKEIEEKQTPPTPQTQQPIKTEQIQAPNTGFSGSISALALSIFSLLSVATFLSVKNNF